MDRKSVRKVVTEYRLTAAIAQNRIRGLAVKSDTIIWSSHAHERMEEREIYDIDVLRVLRSGLIVGNPELTSTGEWKCKVSSPIRGAREVGVVTIILKSNRLFIKTVEWEDLQ